MRPTYRWFVVLLLFVFFLVLMARNNYAYWVIENERLTWKEGDILGTSKHREYTYAFASETTPDPTETPTPTEEPPTPTPTDVGVGAASEQGGPTATPNPPTPTHTPTPSPTSSFRSGLGSGVGINVSLTPTSVTPSPRPFTATPTPLPQWLLDRIFGSLFSGNQSQPTPTPTQTPERSPTPTVRPNEEQTQPPPLPTPTQIPSGSGNNSSGQVFPQPSPTPSVSSSSFFTKTVTAKEEVYIVNTETVREISLASSNQTTRSIKPSPRPLVDARTALIQEELANRNKATGVAIRLDSSSGDSLSTVQDRFMIERANQIVTITNVESAQHSDSGLEINSNNVIARSTMALVVDTVSHVLTVETEQGKQRVSFMPDEAAGIIAEIKALDTTDPRNPILLTTFEGKLVYQITGSKMEKLLGFMPVAIQKQIVLSADTGSVVRVESPLLFKLLSLLTF